MAFEDMNMDAEPEINGTPPPPEESSNRTFIIVAAILGGITLLALLCIAVYALVYVPQRRSSQATQVAQLNAQNTEVAQAITKTSLAFAFTPTPTITPIPNTSTPTSTPVVAVPTNTLIPTQDPRTATVAALLTQAAEAQKTVVPTSTALPTTGFADEVGIPGLLGMAVLLVAVIFLARRFRSA
jgi:LPXTG-motif cell wall-anchored protein